MTTETTTEKYVRLHAGAIGDHRQTWLLERLGADVHVHNAHQMFLDSWYRDPREDDRYRLLMGRPGNYKVAGRWVGRVPLSELVKPLGISPADLEGVLLAAEAVTRKPDGRLTGETRLAVTIDECEGGD